uniref:Uncharacterized protein n=1 Tax=Opuntia streptacantha TaxID=393608 RepID=A0A7C9E2K5_OPUST
MHNPISPLLYFLLKTQNFLFFFGSQYHQNGVGFFTMPYAKSPSGHHQQQPINIPTPKLVVPVFISFTASNLENMQFSEHKKDDVFEYFAASLRWKKWRMKIPVS